MSEEVIELAEDREPWTRQPDEKSIAFDLFTVYRDLGPLRSLTKTVARTERSMSSCARACRRYRWPERAQAYDEEVDRIRREERNLAIRRMEDRHAETGRALEGKALEHLFGSEKKGIAAIKFDQLAPVDLLKFLESGVKMERTAMGEPDVVTTTKIEHSDEDSRDRLSRLLARVASATQEGSVHPDADEQGSSPADGVVVVPQAPESDDSEW